MSMVSSMESSTILRPMPIIYGVKVLTWGTSFDAGNGMLPVLDSMLFGGNSGHAALELTFPSNEKGKRLMDLCEKNYIPCEEKTVVYRDQNGTEIQEKVIQVYWSWCSYTGEEDKSFPHAFQDAAGDLLSARRAVHFEWDLEKLEKLQLESPEQRLHRGMLGSKVAFYGPEEVLHTRNLSQSQLAFLEEKRARDLLTKKESAMKILGEKLLKNKQKLTKNKSIRLGITEQLILNKYLPEWKKLVANPNKVNEGELNTLINLKDKYLLQVKSIDFLEDSGILIKIFNDLKGHLQDNPIVLSDNIKKYIHIFINLNVKEGEKKKMISDLTGEELTGVIKEVFNDAKDFVKDIMENNENPVKMNVAKSLKAENLKTSIAVLEGYLNAQTPIPLNEFLSSTLDDLIPFLGNWKDIIGDVQEINPMQIRDLYTKANIEYEKVKNDIIPFNYDLIKLPRDLSKIEASSLNEYLTTGTPITQVVTLPIRPITEEPLEGVTPQAANQGLDVEAMLNKMIELSDKSAQKYSAIDKNCASTASSILEAGAPTKKQKQFFKKHAFGFLATPQDCFNNALAFQSDFYNNQKRSFFSQIKNPLTKLRGKIIKVLVDPNASGLKKFGAIASGSIVVPIALTLFVVQKILNPLGTVKGAIGFTNYAFSKDSIALKSLSLLMLVPAMVLAPLAAMQYGMKKLIVEPVNKLLNAKPKWDHSSVSLMTADQVQIENQQSLCLKKVIDSFIAEIDSKAMIENSEVGSDPKKALEVFERKLKEDQYCIPVFNKEIQAKVIGYINKNPEKKEGYDALMLKAANRVVDVMKQYKEEEAKVLKKIKPN